MSQQGLSRILEVLAGFSRTLEVLDYRGQQGLVGFQRSQKEDCRDPIMILEVRFNLILEVLGGFNVMLAAFYRSQQDFRSLSIILRQQGFEILAGYRNGFQRSRLDFGKVLVCLRIITGFDVVLEVFAGFRRVLEDFIGI